jgi:D-alanyl-D-alanine dipeptidase
MREYLLGLVCIIAGSIIFTSCTSQFTVPEVQPVPIETETTITEDIDTFEEYVSETTDSEIVNESSEIHEEPDGLDEELYEAYEEIEPEAPILRTLDNIFDYHGLIDITELSSDFVLDIRYATVNNFTGIQQYPFPLALMQKDVAVMLLQAQEKAMRDGFRIRIYDAYRPLSVQGSLYDSTPPELRMYVAKPSSNERHGIGIAIDCGLSDMVGNEIEMPSEFDEFNESAHIDYTGGTLEQRQNRDYLINLMHSCGFTVYNKEWWHFSAPNTNGLYAMDISFDEFVQLRELSYNVE